jgi:hypothetical protein
VATPDPSAVRAWARGNGFRVAGRGRIPTEVVDAYTAARRTGSGLPARAASSRGRSAMPAATPDPAPEPPLTSPRGRLAELASEFAALAADFSVLRREAASGTGSAAGPTPRTAAVQGAAARPVRRRTVRPRQPRDTG